MEASCSRWLPRRRAVTRGGVAGFRPGGALLVASVVCAWSASACAQERPGKDRTQAARLAMVEVISRYGVRDTAVLRALSVVPRHEFVPAASRSLAYGDHPLPVGHGQTISQPYIVAFMTELLEVRPGMKVLEVGTGSGYQAAVLAEIGARVFTVEIFEALATEARARLSRLGYDVTVRHADGNLGWPEEAPFDAIIVTAAAEHIPPALVEQLAAGGRLVIPVGRVSGVQELILVEKIGRAHV